MSFIKSFNANIERGFVPQRKIVPEYQTLAEQALNFEKAVSIPKRVNELAERIELIENTISLMRQTMKSDPVKAYLAPLCSRIGQIEAQMGLERALTKEPVDLPQIIVPHELRVLKGNAGKCKNRKYEVVKKRWALWKAQHEAGIPIITISRAWNCDHASILHAKKKGWEPSKQGKRNCTANRKRPQK